MFVRRSVLVVLALSSLVAGCRLFRPVNPNVPKTKPGDQGATPVAGQPEQAAAKAAPVRAGGSVSDANIAAMVLASNNTDISYARLVPSRAERPDVKEFAARMLSDHSTVNQLVNDLLKKLDVTPEDNMASLDMRDESANKRDILRELAGYKFDSTYIENEVSYHQRFLASIDNVMLARARNAELRSLLTSVRPAVAAHLAHAEQVRANVLSKK
jgi:putative membrane protein